MFKKTIGKSRLGWVLGCREELQDCFKFSCCAVLH